MPTLEGHLEEPGAQAQLALAIDIAAETPSALLCYEAAAAGWALSNQNDLLGFGCEKAGGPSPGFIPAGFVRPISPVVTGRR